MVDDRTRDGRHLYLSNVGYFDKKCKIVLTTIRI